MNTRVLWMKFKQPESKKRKNLLGANTERERRGTPVFPEKVEKIQAEP